jgi:hypothetical protein
VEGTLIAQPVEALPDREPPLVVLSLDTLGSAHALGQLGAAANLL